MSPSTLTMAPVTPIASTDALDDDGTEQFLGLSDSDTRASMNRNDAEMVARDANRSVRKILHSDAFRKLQESETSSEMTLQLKHSQLELGDVLGNGSFSEVFEIKTSLVDDIEPRKYVVKLLREKLMPDPKLFAACAVGLAKEGAILGTLNHKHILHLRAMSQSGVGSYVTGRNDAFFLVLERLDTMLKDRLFSWTRQSEGMRFSLRGRRRQLECLFAQQLDVAVSLADAVAFMHRNNIVHRDLKPGNIGFTKDGTLKVFDFDVAKVLPEETVEGELFKLTASTGTRRYMSPECGLGKPYNRKTDVYSFSIVLHEILSLEKPYKGINKWEHKKHVFARGQRPVIRKRWPKAIRTLLTQSWSVEVHIRPSMELIHESLLHELSAMVNTERTKRRARFGWQVAAE